MSLACGFTTQHYREIITGFRDRGYHFGSFRDYRPHDQGQIILRHDIDITLEDALRIAQLDADLGVGASYHFLLTAETYNLLSATGQETLAQIRALGQHLGLHIDPSVLQRDAQGNAIPALKELVRQAETIIGPLDAYSLHRPATYGELDGLDEGIPGVALPPSADTLRKQMIYRSDSRRQWYQGCICHELDTFGGAPVQLLLHPVWWTPHSCTREQVITNLLNEHQEAMDRYLDHNLSFYARRQTMGADALSEHRADQ